MSDKTVKIVLIALLVLWLFIYMVDEIAGIAWANYTLHRMFTWAPTVIIAIYWLTFGGARKK